VNTPGRTRWQDILYTEPEPSRPLTLTELRRLRDLGFETLARQLAAGTCDRCGMNKLGTGHRQLCVEPEQLRNPLPATEPPCQPWEPRPPSKRLPEAA
jgi:hypothetical protein